MSSSSTQASTTTTSRLLPLAVLLSLRLTQLERPSPSHGDSDSAESARDCQSRRPGGQWGTASGTGSPNQAATGSASGNLKYY